MREPSRVALPDRGAGTSLPVRFQSPQLPPVAAIARYFRAAETARWYSNGGPCWHELGDRLGGFVGGGVRCVPLASGTLALMLGLRALASRHGRRRGVLLPSFTFVATVQAVLWAGLEPVFVDVDEASWQLSPQALADALDAHTGDIAVVLACSTYGFPPAPETTIAWEELARAQGCGLLVDSAAGFGAIDDTGRRLGAQGDAEIFSFHATKPFAIGEGGLLCTRDPELAARVTRLANFGFEGRDVRDAGGLNAKLAEWPAATGLAVLDGFEHVLAQRRVRGERMTAAAHASGYDGPPRNGRPAWQFVPLAAPDPAARTAALHRAASASIELRTYYEQPLHTMPAYAGIERFGELAATERLARVALSLPMANDLDARAEDRILDVLEVSRP